MTGTDQALSRAVALARQGDGAGARALAERSLAEGGDPVPLNAFLGMLACQARDFARGAAHLRAAHSARPDDVTIALNLAHALLDGGDAAAALVVCNERLATADASHRVWRMRGYLTQITGDFIAAVAAYERVVGHYPDDFESWNNLGNARAATGDGKGSLVALRRAVALRSDSAPFRLNLATTLVQLGQLDEAAATLRRTAADFPADAKPLVELAGLLKRQGQDDAAIGVLAEAAAREPGDVELQVQYGTALATAWRMEEAEQVFAGARTLDPAHRDAHVRLSLVYEHTNRAASLLDHVAAAEAAGVPASGVNFTRALHHRHAQQFDAGLAALDATGADVEPVRQAQMRGQFLDRLGQPEAAFAAFAEMNRRLVAERPEMLAAAAAYRDEVLRERGVAIPPWFDSWRPVAVAASRTPVFLVGFPRSGTTLLDTLLMGHPDVQVLEERPPLVVAEKTIGGLDALPTADDTAIAAARAAYFVEAAKWIPLRDDSLLVDKFPLHMNKVPLIRRLFPDARFILALRHPADVVLSCFITNFRPNQAMSNFVDLETAARLYDLSFGFFQDMRATLSLPIHEIRYEAMVADGASELAPLFGWLGLDWRDDLLDHRGTALERGVITTASYAQVTEPIYRRAAGRWHRYADAMAPVMPILARWIEGLGYD